MDVARPTRLPSPAADPPAPQGLTPDGFEDALRRLRTENLHLKLALRHRAVIEQAKGLFAARSGCDLEEAFTQLVRAARDTNKKLVDVAASYVAEVTGTTASADTPADPDDPLDGAPPDPYMASTDRENDPGRPVPDELVALLRERAARRDGPSPTPSAAALRLALAAVEDADGPRDLLASALADCVWPSAPQGAALYTLAGDGALELLATVGYERRDMSIWRRIPPVLRLPVVAAAQGDAVFMEVPEETERLFPDLERARFVSRVFAALPLSVGRRRIGVLFLSWPEPVTFTDDDRASLTLLAEGTARCLLPMLHSPRRETGRSVAHEDALLLEAFTTPGLVVVPTTDGPGSVTDAEIVEANAAAVSDLSRRCDLPADPVGRTLLELCPFGTTPTSTVLDAVRRVLSGGESRDVETRAGTVRVVRWSDGAVLTWTAAMPSSSDRIPRQDGAGSGPRGVPDGLDPAHEAELLTGVGGMLVDPRLSRVRISDGLRRLLRLSPQGPVALADVLACFPVAVRGRLRDALARVLTTGDPFTVCTTVVHGERVTVWLDRRHEDTGPVVVLAVARERR